MSSSARAWAGRRGVPGCLVALAALILVPVVTMLLGQVALAREIARVRAQCTPARLLEVTDSRLFTARSAQTRSNDTPDAEVWRVETEAAREISSIPLTSKTITHRIVLHHQDREVAALKYLSVTSARLPLIERTMLFSCGEVLFEFYVDKMEHEFGGRPSGPAASQDDVTVVRFQP